MSAEKQTQIEAEAPKTEGQAVVERLEKPETKQALADKLAKKPMTNRALEFKANPPDSSFATKEFAIDENLKGKKMEAQVKTNLNIRNAEGKVSSSGKPGETFTLTGETTKDGRFVGIESGNGEKKFVAVSYLKDAKADQAKTAPKPETTEKWPAKADAAKKPNESDVAPKDKPAPKSETPGAKTETEPVQEAQKTQPKPADSKEKAGELLSTEPGKPIVTQEGNYEWQYRMTNGKPVFEGQGKVSKDWLSFEGTFKKGSPDWVGVITSGAQSIEAKFRGFRIEEGPGKITFDGSTKEWTFKFENRVSMKTTPTGGTETTTDKKVVFESEGVLYRANPKTSQFEVVTAEQVSETQPTKTGNAESGSEKLSESEKTGREIVSNGEVLKRDLTKIKDGARLWNIQETADSASARIKEYLDTNEPKLQALSKDKAGLSGQTRTDIEFQLEELARLAKMAEWSSLVPEKTKQEVKQYSQRVDSMLSNMA